MRIATFITGNTKATPASFTATVNWGDGTYVSGSNVSIDKVKGATGKFQVLAGHTYTMPGEYPLAVTVSSVGGSQLVLSSTVNLSAGSIGISGTDLAIPGGVLTNKPVATFSDNGPAPAASIYSASINWGDGIVSTGTVTGKGTGPFTIRGSHSYATNADYTVSATVARTGSAAATAYEWSTAHVTGVNSPSLLPPFPHAHISQIWSAVYSDSNSIIQTGSSVGYNPYATLFLDASNGLMYGACSKGGANGTAGAIFQLSTSGSISQFVVQYAEPRYT